jgi:AhpD family alkylhydroperoxidase
MREMMRSKRVERSFMEKIMLVITQVNGCRYCSYFHTQMALTSGVSETEIEQLVALEIGDFRLSRRWRWRMLSIMLKADAAQTPMLRLAFDRIMDRRSVQIS